MRNLPFRDAGFAWVLNFFTSFGYFETERENFRVLEEIVRLLRPGGRFMIDFLNRERVLAELKARESQSIGGRDVAIERWYDPATRRINKRMRLAASAGGRSTSYLESVRAYSSDEVTIGARWAGLEVDALYGDFTGESYQRESPRLIVVGHKPPSQLDLAGSGRLAALPAAFLRGDDRELLAPLAFLRARRRRSRQPAGAGPASLAGGARRRAGRSQRRATAMRGPAELAAKLADPGYPGGGLRPAAGAMGRPLLGLVKALAAARYAAELEAAGVPAVAIFWVATEDHDWAEASRAVLPGHQGPLAIELGADPQPLAPLAERQLGRRDRRGRRPGGSSCSAAAPTFERWRHEVAPLFAADAALGEAYCRLFAKILGEHSPLLMDATLPALKEAERPFLRQLIEDRHRLDAAYAAAEARAEARGYSLQVRPQRAVSPLFLVHGGERRRIEFPGPETWALRGVAGSERPIAELLEHRRRRSRQPLARGAGPAGDPGRGARHHPPGDGPGRALLPGAGGRRLRDPRHRRPRPPPCGRRRWLLEDRQASWLEELGLPLADLLAQPVETALTSRLGGNLVEAVRQRGGRAARRLAPAAARSRRQPRNALAQEPRADRSHLEQLEAKATASAARRHEVQLRRLEQLKQAILPDDHAAGAGGRHRLFLRPLRRYAGAGPVAAASISRRASFR